MKMNILNTYNILNTLYENYSPEEGKQINLNNCRMIKTDVVDIRGEYETNACIDYLPNGATEPVLTRVQVRIILTRNNGTEFLCKRHGYGIQLPGGGYDATKDAGDILNTAKRELREELNIKAKNLYDSGIRSWRYREDDFVKQHVDNPNDWWKGYYSFLVLGEYDRESDNDSPEELGSYKWHPIEILKKDKNKFYQQALSKLNSQPVSEAWGNEHGKQDYTIPGLVSYCCENPVILDAILESNFIKRAEAPETHETDTIDNGNTGRGRHKTPARYPYVSFSKQLFSHAYRRPEKWGFGVVLDEGILKQHYDLTDRDHTYNDLRFSSVLENENHEYMVQCDLFGYVEVPEDIALIILEQMFNKSEKQINKYSKVDKPFNNMPRDKAWQLDSTEVTAKQYRSVNSELKNKKFNTKYGFVGGKKQLSQFAVHIREFSPENRKKIMDYLLNETYYNEGEERIWLKNNETGITIPHGCIKGIIMPEIIKPEFEQLAVNEGLSNTQTAALADVGKYAVKNNLDVYYHDALDDYHISKIDRLHNITSINTR